MHSNRPPTVPQTQRRVSVNPFAAVLQDDEEDVTPILVESLKPPHPSNPINDDNPEQNDEDDDDCSQTSQSSSNARRVRPPRPSMAIVASKRNMSQQQRRRRRSSARFLQLSKVTKGSTNIDEDEEEDDDDIGHLPSTASQKGTLQEMYQTAIRMNAENKINTTNSWNLHIIDQMDALLSLNEGIDTSSTLSSKASNQVTDKDDATNPKEPRTRVNFTKASCTLDASVKIYSYRVDDVHLTSYKVLANLNRTQNNKNDKSTSQTTDDKADGEDDEARNEKSSRKDSNKTSSGSTLETNIANINLNKLDSAYDIDPLFHKMSKTFDEGGAKGLLLANLGVSESSCRIVFDSSANDVHGGAETTIPSNPAQDPTRYNDQDQPSRMAEGMMDITSLTEKLKSLLSEYCDDDDDWDIDSGNANSLRSVPLVPQLSALRSEHEKLVELGCCGPDAATALASTIGPKTPAGKLRKYHANSEQEQDADYSIHKEAIERSHRKLNFSTEDINMTPRNDLFPNDGTDHHSKAFTLENETPMDEDYGGGFGYDDGVDDDDDHCFDAFIANARYSEVSLVPPTEQAGTSASNLMMQPQPSTFVANFIDAIASGTTVLSNSDYEYFSSKGNKSNNAWAGAAHWKRDNANAGNDTKSKKKGKASKKKSTKSKKRDVGDEAFVVFNPSVAPDLSHLLRPTTKRRGINTSSASMLLSKAMVAKYTDEENVLPHDVGFQNDNNHKNSLCQLTKLFLCPQMSILQPLDQNQMRPGKDDNTNVVEPKKMVEFNLPSNTEWDDDNDDGPGFDFGGDGNDDDDDEFVVPLLDNVRKVDKIRVGYATVAKKVDVKRLKRDLWNELESHFINDTTTIEDNIDLPITDVSESETSLLTSSNGIPNPSEPTMISFQETVRILGQEQSQTDITLPFYFICILHLANEKGLRLEQGNDDAESTEAQQRLLSDFSIYRDELLTNDIY